MPLLLPPQRNRPSNGKGGHTLNIIHGARPWATFDPDTSRIWWEDVGVHQNLTHAVHPDPISGAHCWLQKAVSVRKANANERHGDVYVNTNRSMKVYQDWKALTRSAIDVSPDDTRRPLWLKRPLKPVVEAYKLPEKPFGRNGRNGKEPWTLCYNPNADSSS